MVTTILTVALNAAVDVTHEVPAFAVGRINMAAVTRKVAGGKANNVARVLTRLDQRVLATGFAGGGAGAFIQSDLARHGITPEFEPTDGENRTCAAIIDPAGQTLTELREKGPTLTAADAERFVARFTRLLARAGLVVISGSLPPGVPGDFYARLVELAHTRGVRVLLDASGKALTAALPARPFLVKPNLEELSEWAGQPLQQPAEILAAARAMLAAGPEMIALSLGADGLLLITPDQVIQAVPPRITPVNTVGSGDSAVAGLATGLLRGLPLPELARLAVACGTANALTTGVAEVNPSDVERLLPQVTVRS